MHHQHASPLFVLPYEIRLAIYDLYLLPSNQPDYFLCTSRPAQTFLLRGPFRRDNIPGLVLACKRLHHELAPLVFNTITYVVRHEYHRGCTALGSFGFLDLSRITKVVYIMERTKASAWWDDFFEVLTSKAHRRARFDGEFNAPWLLQRPGYVPYFKSKRDVPVLTGLREVVFYWAPETMQLKTRSGKWPFSVHLQPKDDLPDRETDPRGELVCPALDHVVSLDLDKIHLGGNYGDWWVKYLEERTTARIVLDGPPSETVFTGIGVKTKIFGWARTTWKAHRGRHPGFPGIFLSRSRQ